MAGNRIYWNQRFCDSEAVRELLRQESEAMAGTVGIGNQDFEVKGRIFLRRQNIFHQAMVGGRGPGNADHPSPEIWKDPEYEHGGKILFSGIRRA